ncbi:MAG: GxxExxY protein [Chitinophagales bacterium]|nr:GxxExxY protein [Bacteroidota bacterium]
MKENDIATKVIGIAIEVHKQLGPGLLESTYKACLAHKLKQAGFHVECEKAIPVVFEDVKLECGYRADLVVERCLVIEIKSVDVLNDVHLAQALTYVKLGGFKLGLLINFNTLFLKDGIRRVINS